MASGLGCLIVLCLFAPTLGGADTWSDTGQTVYGHLRHATTLLPNGKVLVVAGSTAEIYDPATASWSVAASPSVAHQEHGATPSGFSDLDASVVPHRFFRAVTS